MDRFSSETDPSLCLEFNHIPSFYSYFLKTQLASLSHKPQLCYIYFLDITRGNFNINFYRATLENLGLIPVVPGKVSSEWAGWEFRSLMYRLLINPDYSMCSAINNHLRKLHERTMIGIQLRHGGTTANYHERRIQGDYAMNVALNEAAKYMNSHGLNRDNTYLYISTDSSLILEKIKKIVNETGVDFMYHMDDFSIGHSATGKSGLLGKSVWNSFYHRALMDMFILKDSDYLIVSQGSSFGNIAVELQKTYNNEVSSESFLKQKGFTCSVYSQRTKAGESFVISQKRGYTERQLFFNV